MFLNTSCAGSGAFAVPAGLDRGPHRGLLKNTTAAPCWQRMLASIRASCCDLPRQFLPSDAATSRVASDFALRCAIGRAGPRRNWRLSLSFSPTVPRRGRVHNPGPDSVTVHGRRASTANAAFCSASMTAVPSSLRRTGESRDGRDPSWQSSRTKVLRSARHHDERRIGIPARAQSRASFARRRSFLANGIAALSTPGNHLEDLAMSPTGCRDPFLPPSSRRAMREIASARGTVTRCTTLERPCGTRPTEVHLCRSLAARLVLSPRRRRSAGSRGPVNPTIENLQASLAAGPLLPSTSSTVPDPHPRHTLQHVALAVVKCGTSSTRSMRQASGVPRSTCCTLAFS